MSVVALPNVRERSLDLPDGLLPIPERIDCPPEDAPLQYLALSIPCYTWVSTQFFNVMVLLVKRHPAPIDLAVTMGVYLVHAMRTMMETLAEHPGWQRLLVVEQDMLIPEDALRKHAQHTVDIVGSMYFQHTFPFHANVLYRHPQKGIVCPPEPAFVQHMVENPGLWKCDSVGFGCTSIARRVFESWDYDIPIWRSEESKTEAGHDTWFCSRAKEQGFQSYLDSSILCKHLTEHPINYNDYVAANNLDGTNHG